MNRIIIFNIVKYYINKLVYIIKKHKSNWIYFLRKEKININQKKYNQIYFQNEN